MASDDEREIYRQRFEAERSAYRLEWQLFQVGVAIGLVTLGLGEHASDPKWWPFLISGAVFVKFSYAMQRIAKGFRGNREKLSEYASKVGDCIPNGLSKPWESAAVRARLILHTVGVILIVHALHNSSVTPCWPASLRLLVIAGLLVELVLWILWQFSDTYKWVKSILPCIRGTIAVIVILIMLVVIFLVICSFVA